MQVLDLLNFAAMGTMSPVLKAELEPAQDSITQIIGSKPQSSDALIGERYLLRSKECFRYQIDEHLTI